MIDDDNFGQATVDYFQEKHFERVKHLGEKYKNEFPELDMDLPYELAYKNFLSWLLFEKILPETGQTLAEEFAQNATNIKQETKEKIMQIRKVIRSEFVVVSLDRDCIKLKDRRTNENYFVTTNPRNAYCPNDVITARIHPFGDRHKFLGITQIRRSPIVQDFAVMFEAFQAREIQKRESMIIKPDSPLTSILNRYPANWVDCICQNLQIRERMKKEKAIQIQYKITNQNREILNRLPEKSKQILKKILQKGGHAKYAAIEEFEEPDEEESMFWEKDQKTTPINALKQNGLLVIATMRIGDRKYKMAFIPIEARESFQQYFNSN